MTKHVVNNNQVPHLWAHQAQDWAKGGGSISFEGRILKSYWLPIGNIVEDATGNNVALILDRYRSVTTMHHISMADRAVSGVMPCFRVLSVDGSEAAHKRNVEWFLSEYRDLLAKGKRGSLDNKEYRLNSATRFYNTAHDYATRFAVGDVEWPNEAEEVAAYEAHWAKREAKLNDPKLAEKRERARVAKEARERRDYREGKGRYAFGNHLSYRGWDRLRDLGITAEDHAAREAKAAVVNADQITGWRNHQISRAPYNELGALLRLSRDGRTIETSQGAQFPVEHGKLAFRLIMRCKETGQPWHTNGHTVHLGHYKVDEVDAAGNVRAGCHRVAWTEIELIARQLGLLPCPGAEACKAA